MRKRLFLLFLIFVALYILLHLAYKLPDLANGRIRLFVMPDLPVILIEIGMYFLFALVPYFLLLHFYPRQVLMAIGVILVSLPCIFYVCYRIDEMMMGQDIRLKNFFLQNIFYVSLYTVYGMVFFFIRYAQHKELEQRDLVIQNRQSELSFLRSQINPHFLFNSLHNIYSLMYQNAAGAQEAILSLSDLLRYMLYDASEKVPLQKEVDYIDRYIALQKIRFDHPIHTPVRITGNITAVQIPPLLLIPFVENAFKHGDFSGNTDGVEITLHGGPRSIFFHCINKKDMV
ncbi:sensor histidine kinase [Paraflavitalea speifideaquila]|uniref:sensor histidine kinase n=1 Tax=Paraflavitalea speifideaquila TaxID=3076558 RepID=UPI0028EC8184|nr:sensor histidine kinase [Paraflavitalea speifideiaquila]